MSKAAAARVTKRTIAEIEAAADKVPAIAYDINNYTKLGAIHCFLEDITDQKASEKMSMKSSKQSMLLSVTYVKKNDTMLTARYTNETAKKWDVLKQTKYVPKWLKNGMLKKMINAHDIVCFDKQVIENNDLPDWVTLSDHVFATVRRAMTDYSETLPIGLRGTARNQRFAPEIPTRMVQKVIHPWEITDRESFRQTDIAQFPVYQQFHAAREILSGTKWGVGGSLGF